MLFEHEQIQWENFQQREENSMESSHVWLRRDCYHRARSHSHFCRNDGVEPFEPLVKSLQPAAIELNSQSAPALFRCACDPMYVALGVLQCGPIHVQSSQSAKAQL